MKNFIVLLILTYPLCLSGCGGNGKNGSTNTDIAEVPSVQYAEQITIDKLPAVLERLKNGQTEFDLLGICSSPVACIYFMQENGKFYIDYEARILIARVSYNNNSLEIDETKIDEIIISKSEMCSMISELDSYYQRIINNKRLNLP